MKAVYNFTTLKVTDKGARLITDGSHIAWVSPRAVRPDGTFGDGALRALSLGIPGSTLEDYDKSQKSLIVISLPYHSYEFVSSQSTEKAFFTDYGWFPKSLCSLNQTSEGLTLSLPRWLAQKNDVLYLQLP